MTIKSGIVKKWRKDFFCESLTQDSFMVSKIFGAMYQQEEFQIPKNGLLIYNSDGGPSFNSKGACYFQMCFFLLILFEIELLAQVAKMSKQNNVDKVIKIRTVPNHSKVNKICCKANNHYVNPYSLIENRVLVTGTLVQSPDCSNKIKKQENSLFKISMN